jgi:hypothetical protein
MSKQLMREAQLRAYDKPGEMEKVKGILQETNGLDPVSAQIVAAATRVATLTDIGQDLGLDDDSIGSVINSDQGFGSGADDGSDDDSFSPEAMPVGELDGGKDHEDFGSSDDAIGAAGSDDGMVDVHFEVPQDQLDELDQLLEQFLGHGIEDEDDNEDYGADDSISDPSVQSFGGDDDTPEYDSDEDDSADHAGGSPQFSEGDQADDLSTDEDDHESSNTTMANQVNTMNKSAESRSQLRSAMRDAAIRLASDGTEPKDIGLGSDTSKGTYMGERAESIQHGEKAQYHQEGKAPSTTKDNSGGNSLQGDNPTFNKRRVPTQNPENLGQPEETDVFTFENSGEQLKPSFGKLQIPSKDTDRSPGFAVPTQNPQFTTNRNSDGNVHTAGAGDVDEDFEDHMVRTLEAAGIPERVVASMSLEQGIEAYNEIQARLAAKGAKSDWFKENIEKKGKDDEDLEEVGGDKKKSDTLNVEVTASAGALRQQYANALEHEMKRVKAAYQINTQLAIHGAIRPEEIDSYVETWLEGGLTVKAMVQTGQLVLRTATNAQKLVSAASAEPMVRTSARGTSANPAVVSAPQYGSIDSTDLTGLFSVGNVDRGTFNRLEALREAHEAMAMRHEMNPFF